MPDPNITAPSMSSRLFRWWENRRRVAEARRRWIEETDACDGGVCDFDFGGFCARHAQAPEEISSRAS